MSRKAGELVHDAVVWSDVQLSRREKEFVGLLFGLVDNGYQYELALDWFLAKRWKMKSYSVVARVAVIAVVFGGPPSTPNWAQEVSAGAAARSDVSAPKPTYLLAEFSGSVNGKKLKPGSQVHAEISQDVLAHGKIIVPADTTVVGHVTEVKSRGTDRSSRLGIIFDKILLKHHQERRLQGQVYALAPPTLRRSRVDEPDQMMPPIIGLSGGSNTTTPVRGTAPPQHASRTTIMPPSSSAPVTSAEASSPSYAPSASGPADSRQEAPISLGLAPGVYRLKGLSLSTGPSAETPGPVILSTANDVKLDYGTQVIIKVVDAGALQP